MIKVMRIDNGVVVEGHANYAPLGQDIVCAGVSALYINLLNCLDLLTDDDFDAQIIGDKNIVTFEHLSDAGRLLVDAFLIGINGISEEYPDYVEVTK